MALFGLQIPTESFFDAVLIRLEEMANSEGLSAQEVANGLDVEDVTDAVRTVVNENRKAGSAKSRINSDDVRAELALVVGGGGVKSDSEPADLVVRYLVGLVSQRLAGTDAEFVVDQIGAVKPKTVKALKPKESAAATEKKAHDLAVLAAQFPIDDGFVFYRALRGVFGDAFSKHSALSSFVAELEQMAFAFAPGLFVQKLYWATRTNDGINNEMLVLFANEAATMALSGLERAIFWLVLWQAQLDGLGNKHPQHELRKIVADTTFEAFYKMSALTNSNGVAGFDLASNDRLAKTLRDFEARNVEFNKEFFDTADEDQIEILAKHDEAVALARRDPIDHAARDALARQIRDTFRLRELAVLQAFGTNDARKIVRVIRKVLRRHPNMSNEHRLFLRSLEDESRRFATTDFVLDRVIKFTAARASILYADVENWLEDYVVGLRADPAIPNPDESLADNPLVRLATSLSLGLQNRTQLEDKLRDEDKSLIENTRLLEKRSLAILRQASVKQGLELAAQMSKRLPNGEAILADLVRSAKAVNVNFDLPADTKPNEKVVVLHHPAATRTPHAVPRPARNPVPSRPAITPTPPQPGAHHFVSAMPVANKWPQANRGFAPTLWAFPSVRRGA